MDNKKLGNLYIFSYNRKTSNKAPAGFKIEGGEIVNSDQDLQNKVNKAKKYKEEGKLLEALGIYNQVFDFLSQEAANHAHKAENVKDAKKVRQISSGYFEDAKKFLKQDDLACKISNNMGTIFAELGDTDSAKSMFMQAIDLTPDDMDYKDPKIGLEELNK